MLNRIFSFALSFGVVLLSLSPSARIASASELWQGACRVEFSGTSTLGKWSGDVQTQPFFVSVVDRSKLSTSPVRSAVTAISGELDTGNERRNKSMKEAMKTTSHPEINVRLTPDFTMLQTRPVEENGIFRPTVIPFLVELLGKEYEMTGMVNNCAVNDGVMTFDLDFAVSLKDCGIKTPTVLGIIRVGDTVQVSAKVSLNMSSGSKDT